MGQSVGIDTAYGSISLVFGGLFGVTLAFMAFFMRNTHRVYLPPTCWVKLDYNTGVRHYQYPLAWQCIFCSVCCLALRLIVSGGLALLHDAACYNSCNNDAVF